MFFFILKRGKKHKSRQIFEQYLILLLISNKIVYIDIGTGDNMKKYKTKEKLYELLSRVKIHENVFDEIESLVIKKGITNQFVRMLEKNIDKIESLGQDVTKTNNFEKLKDANGLYSMKFKGKDMNLRLLYSYDEYTNTIMLHLFYERDDSKVERYENHIPIALKRMENWREIQ